MSPSRLRCERRIAVGYGGAPTFGDFLSRDGANAHV